MYDFSLIAFMVCPILDCVLYDNYSMFVFMNYLFLDCKVFMLCLITGCWSVRLMRWSRILLDTVK